MVTDLEGPEKEEGEVVDCEYYARRQTDKGTPYAMCRYVEKVSLAEHPEMAADAVEGKFHYSYSTLRSKSMAEAMER